MGYYTEEMILTNIKEIEIAMKKALQAESYSVGDGQTSTSISRTSIRDLQSQLNWWLLKLEQVSPQKYKDVKDIYSVQSNLRRTNYPIGY